MKIVAHTLVKNEEKWIWYSLMSVIDHVDEIMVWDTGSTDKNIDIVRSISSPKIKLNLIDKVDPNSFTDIRQQMLEKTRSQWLMILDGDEIWPQQAISETSKLIRSSKSKELEYLIHPYYNLLGDVYHYQEPSGGKYHIDKYLGHITIRFFNLSLLPRLHFSRPHGQQGIFDRDQTLVQDRMPRKYKFMDDCRYLHTTHLHRSPEDLEVMKRKFKFKYEMGLKLPENFVYPVSFYLPRPICVPSPWQRTGFSYWLKAGWQTPLKRLRRKFFDLPAGY